MKPSASGSGPAKSMCTVLKQVFLCRKTALLDMLVLVDFDSLTDRARLDKFFDVSPKAWPDVSVSGHFDGLLLTSMVWTEA